MKHSQNSSQANQPDPAPWLAERSGYGGAAVAVAHALDGID
eukprot:gene5191-8797_t